MEWTAEEKDVVRKVGKASSRGDSVSFVLASPQRLSPAHIDIPPKPMCVCMLSYFAYKIHTESTHIQVHVFMCVFVSICFTQ